MQPLNPEPFRNWGDWLIKRATGALGDFRMDFCIAIISTEKFSRGWVGYFQSNTDDIRRVVARYKEHVTFWTISRQVIDRELTGFATAIQHSPEEMWQEFERMPAQRFQPPELIADWFSRMWKNHLLLRPNQLHQPVLQGLTEVTMKLYCQVDQETLGIYSVLQSDRGIVEPLFHRYIGL